MELQSAAERAVAHVRSLTAGPPLDRRLRVTLNFHPDRKSGGGSMIDLLAGTGAYVSQFITGTSNGGLTARPGGDRWRWEHRIFAVAYDRSAPGDRRYRGTAVEQTAARLGCAVQWHGGFRLGTDVLVRQAEYRGRETVDLGLRLAVDGMLDRGILGTALRHRPR